MKQYYGMSRSGNLAEAIQGLRNPQFIMLLSNDTQFEEHVAALEKAFPGVPSIGCIGMCYLTDVVEHGVGVIAYSDGVTAAANVLENVSTMPVKYIKRLEQDIQTVGGSGRDTVCIDSDMLEEGQTTCPNCGELLEFDLEEDCGDDHCDCDK